MTSKEHQEKAEKFITEKFGEGWKDQVANMDLASKDKLMLELMEQGVTDPCALSKVLRVSGKHIKSVMERLKGEGKVVFPSSADRKTAMAIREARKDASKPILAKEIEDAAWFHNLLHDLGNYTYHKLVKCVDWGPEEIADPKQAFNRLSAFLDDLMELKEDAARLQKVEMDRDVLDIYLNFALDLIDELSYWLSAYKWFADLMVRVMCPRCSQSVINHMVASGAIKVAPEVVLGKRATEAKGGGQGERRG